MVQEIEIVEVDIDGRSFRVRPVSPDVLRSGMGSGPGGLDSRRRFLNSMNAGKPWRYPTSIVGGGLPMTCIPREVIRKIPRQSDSNRAAFHR